jgi:hypothetical protein
MGQDQNNLLSTVSHKDEHVSAESGRYFKQSLLFAREVALLPTKLRASYSAAKVAGSQRLRAPSAVVSSFL